MFDAETPVRLNYIHDPTISGLVEAKKVAGEMSSEDIVCFLEDDVVLEDGYLKCIEAGFSNTPDMLGCSGVLSLHWVRNHS